MANATIVGVLREVNRSEYTITTSLVVRNIAIMEKNCGARWLGVVVAESRTRDVREHVS